MRFVGSTFRGLSLTGGFVLAALVSTAFSADREPDDRAVRWTCGFWAERFDLCRTATLPAIERALHDTTNAACLDNFLAAAGDKPRRHCGAAWGDGDCYKWLEAMARVYGVTRDPELDRKLDRWIGVIGRAQAADGYLSTNIQLDPAKERLKIRIEHEDYNMGHLLTAACVHHRVTGKDSFLRIVRCVADYLYGVFRGKPRDLVHFGWNPSQMMGLVDLYRETGDRRYLELADVFVTMRGAAPGDFGKLPGYVVRDAGDQNQDRVPLRKETDAVGHVVTATYLYCGAADVCAETGDAAIRTALERIWRDAVGHKMYLTGGAAALHQGVSRRGDRVHEAFGAPYELPNASAYNETCANIGMAMWAWRMLRLTGDAQYADAMEQVLYNSMLSAMSLDGTRFFYTNPLRWHGRDHQPLSNDAPQRWSTWKCYCCPPQVARCLAWLHHWAYGLADNAVWVHLYGGSRLETKLADGSTLAMAQETDYPWDGRVKIRIQRAPDKALGLRLRIPAWTHAASLAINGRAADVELKPGTYASVSRAWAPGDTIELDLPMRPRLMEANPRAEEIRNHLAVMRGPVVYCLESVDLPSGVKVSEIRLPRDVQLAPARERKVLGDVVLLRGRGVRMPEGDWSGRVYREFSGPKAEPIELTLIPYYAWANRGVAEMSVWLPMD